MKPCSVPPTRKPCVFVMVKEPRPGRVKTRLGRDIGMLAAAHWYRHQIVRQFDTLLDARWHSVAAVSPARAKLPLCKAEMAVPQGHGDLGRRMIRVLRQAPPKSVLIGSDILGVGQAEIARAMASLATHDSVLGPSPDGGYWLIGFRNPARLSPFLLDGVRWSSRHALADTIARLPGSVALADERNDVDTVDDLP